MINDECDVVGCTCKAKVEIEEKNGVIHAVCREHINGCEIIDQIKEGVL